MVLATDRKLWFVLLGLLLAACGAWLLSVGPREAKDTVGYLSGSTFRTAGYPLFLALNRLLPGDLLWTTVGIQIALQLGTIGWFAVHLSRLLKLSGPTMLAVAALLLLPPLLLSSANYVLTEGLAYPLFLASTGQLLTALVADRPRAFAAHTAFLSLALLVRPQFLFLVPVSMLVALRIAQRRRSFRVAGVVMACLLAAVLASGLLDRGWHHLKHGAFAPVPFTGVHIVASALYVSEADDADRLDPEDRPLFGRLRSRAEERGLLLASNPHPGSLASFGEHYATTYNDIVWGTVIAELDEKLSESEMEGWRAADRQLVRMSLALIAANPGKILHLYFANITHGVGTRYLLLLGCLFAMTAMSSYRGNVVALAATVGILLHLANAFFLALLQVVGLRYLFYTDFLHLALIVALLSTWSTAEPLANSQRPTAT